MLKYSKNILILHRSLVYVVFHNLENAMSTSFDISGLFCFEGCYFGILSSWCCTFVLSVCVCALCVCVCVCVCVCDGDEFLVSRL